MQCPNGCSTQMEGIKQNKIFYRVSEPIVVTDLTIHVCPNCGQESMPLSSTRLVADILNGKVKSAGKFVTEKYELGEVC